MKLLDKLKNALFEEEYVEVEEKPKKKVQKRENKVDRAENINDVEKPIAKKIVLPEKNEVKITSYDNNEDIIEKQEEKKKEYNFPMVSDSEFTSSNEVVSSQLDVDVYEDRKEKEEYVKPIKEQVQQNVTVHIEKKSHSKPYGIDDFSIPEPEYGTYEKDDRSYFKPSPIISPIYGILDKNYKKDEIVPRKEVRITSSYSRENLDLDAIRNKAYGNLVDDTDNKENDEPEESNFMDQDLVDLSSEDNTPEIKKVTVGDAEEYFNDLGLEYNVDYKDRQKEKASGRRYKEEDSPTEDYEEVAPVIDAEEYEAKMEQQENKDIDDDNLFDLIDSMYEKE